RLLPDSTVEDEPESTQLNLEEALTSLEKTNAESLALQNEVKQKETEIIQLQNQISLLEHELEEKLISHDEYQMKINDLADIYTGMSAKKAAAILENLTLNEAALLIK